LQPDAIFTDMITVTSKALKKHELPIAVEAIRKHFAK